MDNSNINNSAMLDEVAAAEAELRAAQEKLEAARARAAAQQVAATAAPYATATQQAAAAPYAVAAPQTEEYRPPSYQTTRPAEPQSPWGQPTGQAYGQSYGRPQQPGQSACQQPGGTDYVPPSGQPYGQAYGQPPYQQSHPYAARTTKDHVAAGLLGIFLGSLGIHKFYLGYNKPGFIMLAITVLGSILTFGLAGAIMCLIGFIEGIIYLVKSQSDFERIYVFGQKEWF